MKPLCPRCLVPPLPLLLVILPVVLSVILLPPLPLVRAEEAPRQYQHGLDLQLRLFDELRKALHVMTSTYFALWLGAWTTASDWTAAVMNTQLASSLAALSKALDDTHAGTAGGTAANVMSGGGSSSRSSTASASASARELENELNRYFAQCSAFYFGEDVIPLRNEAFDDMLWVVLAWLQHVRFIHAHTRTHARLYDHRHRPRDDDDDDDDDDELSPPPAWHGEQFRAAFVHRAHVFYDLASGGWDDRLCGGGMNWDPALEPYKNSITNQLWISASVSMYLHFPGILRTPPPGTAS